MRRPAEIPLVTRPDSKPRRTPLIRSAGIRFALLYAMVFGLNGIILAFSLWYSTVGLLQRQVEAAIRADAAGLSEHFSEGGLPSVLVTISNRLASNADDNAIYLVVDPLGNRIAGNLQHWPTGMDTADAWYELPVTHAGTKSLALLREFQLPGGFRLLVGRDVSTRAALRRVLRNGLLFALGVMLLLGALGAVLIRSLFRRALADISFTTRAIARGDLSRRVRRTGDGDEFDQLAETINDMLDRIGRLMDGVRQVSNAIAHDLRTPITRARARLEDAALHAESEPELRAAVERATSDLDGIVSVFQALLRIAEIEAGSRRSAFAPIDLTPLVDDLAELYGAVAEERGAELTCSRNNQLPILGDRDLIQQAIANLLDNALKFSPDHGVIELNAVRSETGVEISVADRGPGIPEADRLRATERFFRAETARNTPGSGLGLALVAAVAQLHNGTLRLEDHHPGLRAVLAIPTDAKMTAPNMQRHPDDTQR